LVNVKKLLHGSKKVANLTVIS